MDREVKKQRRGSPHLVGSETARSRSHHSVARRFVARTALPLYRKSLARGVNLLFQMDYIERTNAFRNQRWLGVPIWQDVLDLWTIQENLAKIKPSLLIETGTFEGGSSMYYAQLFDLLDHGAVITIDIDRQHDLSHPRITYLTGRSSVHPGVVEEVGAAVAKTKGPVMVILDSDHRAPHVRAELESYAPMVSVGSLLLVQDGIIDTAPVPAYRRLRPGPVPAIKDFLAHHSEFVFDDAVQSFPITFHPYGWLRRVRA